MVMQLQFFSAVSIQMPKVWTHCRHMHTRKTKTPHKLRQKAHVSHDPTELLLRTSQPGLYRQKKEIRKSLYGRYTNITVQGNYFLQINQRWRLGSGSRGRFDARPLVQRGLRALLRGPGVAAWWCWGLSHQRKVERSCRKVRMDG